MLLQTEKTTIRDERALKSFTGIDSNRYSVLRSTFSAILQEKAEARYAAQVASGKRKRKPGGGRKSALPSVDDKLLFVLHYHKSYPTMDNMGSEFKMCRSIACKQVHLLSGYLKECLERLKVIPKRELANPQTLINYLKELGDIQELLIDVTERPHRRLADKHLRDALYSGKKSDLQSRTQ